MPGTALTLGTWQRVQLALPALKCSSCHLAGATGIVTNSRTGCGKEDGGAHDSLFQAGPSRCRSKNEGRTQP
jgi:hypothetical protein